MPMSRRTALGAGTLAAAAAAVNVRAQERLMDKPLIRLGIVGCGPYSHCVSYGNVILGLGGRRPNQTRFTIPCVWGDDYSKNFAGEIWRSGAAQRGLASRSPEYFKREAGVTIVDDPADMLGRIDAAMVMDFDRALELAEPFLAEGMPVFVNRPYAPTMEEGRAIINRAAATGSMLATGSLVPFVFETKDAAGMVDRDTLVAFHADGVSASFSRYVPHALEYVYAIVGPGVRRVRLSGWDGSGGYDPSTLPPLIIELEYGDRDGGPLRGTVLMRGHAPHDWWFRGYHADGRLLDSSVPAHDNVDTDTGDGHWRIPFLSAFDYAVRSGESYETPDDIMHKLATLIAAHKSAMEGNRWVGLDETEGHHLPTVITARYDERI